MLKDPVAPGTSTVALLCKSGFVTDKSSFKPALRNQCQYEVLGGLHTVIAKKELMTEFPDVEYFQECLAFVYCGLTDPESLRLASRHNQNGHYSHEMTHRDNVEACRSLLLVKANCSQTDETPPPTAEWKEACKLCILPTTYSTTSMENIMRQASLRSDVYQMASKVMCMFCEGETKGQKPPSNARQMKKTILFKQHYLEPIQSLDHQLQKRLLGSVIKGEMSIQQMMAEAKEIRAMKVVKATFLNTVNLTNWAEAEAKYPIHTVEERLKVFTNMRLKTKNGVCQPFNDYCDAALLHERDQEKAVTLNQCRVDFVDLPYSSISREAILKAVPGFKGATLTIAGNYTQNDSLADDGIKTLVWAAKELNTISTAITQFSVMALCSPQNAGKFKNIMQMHLHSAEVAYVCNNGSKVQPLNELLSQGKTMMPSVAALVIGHWSQDDVLRRKNVSDSTDCLQINFFTYSSQAELWSRVTKAFTAKGETVAVFEEGCEEVIALSTLKSGRNVLSLG